MFGSQALDTAVGLVLMLLVLATAASSILELVNRLGHKRSRDLQRAVGTLLGGTGGSGADATAALEAFRRTSVYAASSSAGSAEPAHLSAKSFADATLELAARAGESAERVLPRQLNDRIATLLQEAGNDVLELRAGLERWFDEAMGRLSDAYKRQASFALGILGFVLAVATNASTPDVVARLWTAPVTRESVISAAQNVGQGRDASALADVARTTDALAQLSIPVGWSGGTPGGFGWWFGHLLGWA
ncbi:MAG: hypothetical protein M3Z83_10910, partial [Actinomycetota bacterium]|nr:hypothetical protein [Actinomycetota bacterium]